MNFRCHHCGAKGEKDASAFNRAAAISANLYCSRKCAGLARRVEKTPEQKKAEKAAYDAKRRAELADKISAEKRAWYEANRERLLVQHAEYRKPVQIATAPRFGCVLFMTRTHGVEDAGARNDGVKGRDDVQA